MTSPVPEDDDEGLPPMVWSSAGQSRIPDDIWEKTCEIVKGFRSLEDNPEFEGDADDMLRTLIATTVYMERAKTRH